MIPPFLQPLLAELQRHVGLELRMDKLSKTLGIPYRTLKRHLAQLRQLQLVHTTRRCHATYVVLVAPAAPSLDPIAAQVLADAHHPRPSAAVPDAPRPRLGPSSCGRSLATCLAPLHAIAPLRAWAPADLEAVLQSLRAPVQLSLDDLYHHCVSFQRYVRSAEPLLKPDARPTGKVPRAYYWLTDPSTDWHSALAGHIAYNHRRGLHARPGANAPAPRGMAAPLAASDPRFDSLRNQFRHLTPTAADSLISGLLRQATADCAGRGIREPELVIHRVLSLAQLPAQEAYDQR